MKSFEENPSAHQIPNRLDLVGNPLGELLDREIFFGVDGSHGS
jgi:hypothetical protein